MSGRRDLTDVGRYRTGKEPMQVVSGPFGRTKVHFEAPPAARVLKEMARFIDWFNRTAPEGLEPLPALTRAGTAHLYFECIHPFEDGNGRIGRALAEKAWRKVWVSRRLPLWRRLSLPVAKATTMRWKREINEPKSADGLPGLRA